MVTINGIKVIYVKKRMPKKLRIKIFEKESGKCEVCKIKGGEDIHHLDQVKCNHIEHNLMLVCKDCHTLIHKTIEKKIVLYDREIKYRKIYMTPAISVTKEELWNLYPDHREFMDM